MDILRKHLAQVVEGINLIDRGEYDGIVTALKVVKESKGTVWLCGNGGSSSLCAHFANDLVKMGRIRAGSLVEAIPLMTAYGNDDGWRYMFVKQLAMRMEPTDMVFGISCSGNSDNVVKALEWAYERKWLTAVLTGCSEDSEVNKVSDVVLHTRGVPDIRVQEDLHTIICHTIARELCEG